MGQDGTQLCDKGQTFCVKFLFNTWYEQMVRNDSLFENESGPEI